MITAGIPKRQIVGRKPESLQDCGVEITEMNCSLDRTIPGRTGLPVNIATFDTSSCQPERKASFIMVGFVLSIIRCQSRTSELSAPDN